MRSLVTFTPLPNILRNMDLFLSPYSVAIICGTKYLVKSIKAFNPTIKIRDIPIPFHSCVRDLGLLLDENLLRNT